MVMGQVEQELLAAFCSEPEPERVSNADVKQNIIRALAEMRSKLNSIRVHPHYTWLMDNEPTRRHLAFMFRSLENALDMTIDSFTKS